MNVPSVRNEAALMPDKLHSFALPPVVVVLYSCLRLPKGRLLVICSSCQLADDDDNAAVDLSRLLFEYLLLVNNILLNSQMIFNIKVFVQPNPTLQLINTLNSHFSNQINLV